MKYADLSKKKRVVVKIGSSSLVHPQTGRLDYIKLDRLVREICDIRNRGMDVCLVSSGAIAVGRQTMGNQAMQAALRDRDGKSTVNMSDRELGVKQALASVGQARLMGAYQQYFSEYGQTSGQVLMTKYSMLDDEALENVRNTFEQLFAMDVIPVVNANDTVSTYEIRFGDNDTLSALVTSVIGGDLLIILSDIDGLFTGNPKDDPEAKLVEYVEDINEDITHMASSQPGSGMGTGGMVTKLKAARIATYSGADMIICNSSDVGILHRIFEDDYKGTFFQANKDESFQIADVLSEENEGNR